MNTDWILREPLVLLDSEDHPYLESARGKLGPHEVAVHLAEDWHQQEQYPEFRVFLDGREIFEWGDASPAKEWFTLCHQLGYKPEFHWDWDPALILFQQVLPALATRWDHVQFPYGPSGVPEGVTCLATLRTNLADWAERLRRPNPTPSEELLALMFHQLPLRAVILHDDPESRLDFVGNPLDAPYMGEFLYLGEQRDTAVVLSRMTFSGTGGMRWSPWLPGGEWSQQGREFAATQGARHFLRAAGLPEATSADFEATFKHSRDNLGKFIEPLVEAYRETCPGGIPWHRDPKNRYVNHMVVQARMEDGQTILVLDDGTELLVTEHHGVSLAEMPEA